MSVRINRERCIGCGRCTEVCPGNLLCLNVEKKAEIRIPEDCWGCTGCVKICPVNAIEYFLGADIGGQGAVMTVAQRGDFYDWKVHFPDGREKTISVDRRSANQY